MTNEMTKDILLKKRKKLQSFRTPNFWDRLLETFDYVNTQEAQTTHFTSPAEFYLILNIS